QRPAVNPDVRDAVAGGVEADRAVRPHHHRGGPAESVVAHAGPQPTRRRRHPKARHIARSRAGRHTNQPANPPARPRRSTRPAADAPCAPAPHPPRPTHDRNAPPPPTRRGAPPPPPPPPPLRGALATPPAPRRYVQRAGCTAARTLRQVDAGRPATRTGRHGR